MKMRQRGPSFQFLGVLAASVSGICGGCPLDVARNVTWSGAPNMRGVWAVADADGGGVLTLFTVDENGQVTEACYQVDLLEYGVKTVTTDGVPHTLAPGLTVQAALDLSEIDGAFLMILDGEVRAAGAPVAAAAGTIAGVIDENGEGYGTSAGRLYKLAKEFVWYVDVILKRISDDPHSCLSDDAFESNDDAARAAPLTAGNYEHLRLLNADWYRIDVLPAQSVLARVHYDSRFGDLSVSVRDAAGLPLPITPRIGASYQQVVLPEGSDRYLLLIEPDPGQFNPDYAVSILPFTDDAFEQNDTSDTAAVVAAGTYEIAVFDDDWFRIEVGGPAIISATLEFVHADGDLDLELWDPAGGLLDSSKSSWSNNESVSTPSLTGSCLVRVYGYGGATNTARLTVTVTR